MLHWEQVNVMQPNNRPRDPCQALCTCKLEVRFFDLHFILRFLVVRTVCLLGSRRDIFNKSPEKSEFIEVK